jgi:DNA-binding NarL/FixJ family response regulator
MLLLNQGLSVKAIAAEMSRSQKRIFQIKKSLLKRLGVTSECAIVSNYEFRYGLTA